MSILDIFRRKQAAVSTELSATVAQYVQARAQTDVDNPYGPFANREAYDQVANWMSGQGGANDPAVAAQWMQAITENWQSLVNVYRVSWLAKKIVRKKPRDMLRPGYNLIWEGSGEKRGERGKKGGKGKVRETEADRVRKACRRRWNADQLVVEAATWARLFGGSVIVLGIKGQLLSDPLPIVEGSVDYSVIGKGGLEWLRVYDRWRANHDGQIDADPLSPNYGKPLYHVLSADAGGMQGQRVHWTRVIRFDGDVVPWWTYRANACWHDSTLQVLVDLLKQYDSMTGAISSLIPKARQDVVMAKKAAEMLSTDAGSQKMARRYAATARMASMYNVAVYDLDTEKSEQRTFQFSGLDKIWEKSMKEVAGATGYPVSILFGDEPAGMNATGDASLRNYYDELAGEREEQVAPQHLALLEVITRNELGRLPDGFSIEYRPFMQMSAAELSDINLKRSQADHQRIEDGIITPGLAARETKEDSLYKTMAQEDVDLAELDVPMPDDDADTDGDADATETAATGNASLALTPTMQGSIITVNQALATMGFPAWPDSDGLLTIAEFQAKHAATVATAANANAGSAPGEESFGLDGFDPEQPRDPNGQWAGGAGGGSGLSSLSEEEHALAREMSSGKSDKKVMASLGISHERAMAMAHEIRTKLGVGIGQSLKERYKSLVKQSKKSAS
jgi:uncharacterized protein